MGEGKRRETRGTEGRDGETEKKGLKTRRQEGGRVKKYGTGIKMERNEGRWSCRQRN